VRRGGIALGTLSPGLLGSSLLPGTVVVSVSACVNALLLFLLGARIDDRRAGRGR